MPDDGPLFIAGLDRSGKTPLRALLDGLPGMVFVRRAYLWTELFGRSGSLHDDAHLAAALASLGRHPELALRASELARVEQRLRPAERTYPRLFASAMDEFAARSGAHRWGVQEALVEIRADAILADDPRARFVHLVRDPRDRHLAAYGRGATAPGRLGVSAARWQASAKLAADNAARHRDHYLVVRYEDLAGAPTDTLRLVCNFIGEAPTAAMLEAADQWGTSAAGTVGGGAGLQPNAVRYLQRRLAEPMGAFAYRPLATPPSVGAPIGDAVTRLVAGAAAWRWGDRDLRPESRTAAARKLPA